MRSRFTSWTYNLTNANALTVCLFKMDVPSVQSILKSSDGSSSHAPERCTDFLPTHGTTERGPYETGGKLWLHGIEVQKAREHIPT